MATTERPTCSTVAARSRERPASRLGWPEVDAVMRSSEGHGGRGMHPPADQRCRRPRSRASAERGTRGSDVRPSRNQGFERRVGPGTTSAMGSMFLSLLILHLAGTDPTSVYNGRQGRLDVHPPRIDAQMKMDGTLDEAVWGEAALLTGFSQFSPSDGIPAADSTEVLVWYSPAAIHFGIRAYEAHGAVHATLEDRDRIGSDDYVQILLSTFDDARQATVLAVNPFGVQSDGALIETGSTQGNGFNNAVVRRESADLSPDFNYESKGRLSDYGYEVEVRVPFKSLRFQPARDQRWGINITRQVQHSGVEDSWVPAKRASASFLAQSGHLVGLTDLR